MWRQYGVKVAAKWRQSRGKSVKSVQFSQLSVVARQFSSVSSVSSVQSVVARQTRGVQAAPRFRESQILAPKHCVASPATGTCEDLRRGEVAWQVPASPHVNLVGNPILPTHSLGRQSLAGRNTNPFYTNFLVDQICAEVTWQVPGLGLAGTCDAERWRGKSRGLATH